MDVGITRSIELPLDREQAWEAISDEALLRTWLADEVELDPRPGGAVAVRFASGEARDGEVDEVDEGTLIRLRWRPSDGRSPETAVELRLSDGEAGGTLLTVVESVPLADPLHHELRSLGWSASLQACAALVLARA